MSNADLYVVNSSGFIRRGWRQERKLRLNISGGSELLQTAAKYIRSTTSKIWKSLSDLVLSKVLHEHLCQSVQLGEAVPKTDQQSSGTPSMDTESQQGLGISPISQQAIKIWVSSLDLQPHEKQQRIKQIKREQWQLQSQIKEIRDKRLKNQPQIVTPLPARPPKTKNPIRVTRKATYSYDSTEQLKKIYTKYRSLFKSRNGETHVHAIQKPIPMLPAQSLSPFLISDKAPSDIQVEQYVNNASYQRSQSPSPLVQPDIQPDLLIQEMNSAGDSSQSRGCFFKVYAADPSQSDDIDIMEIQQQSKLAGAVETSNLSAGRVEIQQSCEPQPQTEEALGENQSEQLWQGNNMEYSSIKQQSQQIQSSSQQKICTPSKQRQQASLREVSPRKIQNRQNVLEPKIDTLLSTFIQDRPQRQSRPAIDNSSQVTEAKPVALQIVNPFLAKSATRSTVTLQDLVDNTGSFFSFLNANSTKPSLLTNQPSIFPQSQPQSTTAFYNNKNSNQQNTIRSFTQPVKPLYFLEKSQQSQKANPFDASYPRIFQSPLKNVNNQSLYYFNSTPNDVYSHNNNLSMPRLSTTTNTTALTSYSTAMETETRYPSEGTHNYSSLWTPANNIPMGSQPYQHQQQQHQQRISTPNLFHDTNAAASLFTVKEPKQQPVGNSYLSVYNARQKRNAKLKKQKERIA